MKTLILLIILFTNSYSQEYVTPEELEEGWGFGYDYVFGQVNSSPKTTIYSFSFSPNQKYLYLNYMYFYNQKRIFNNEIFELNSNHKLEVSNLGEAVIWDYDNKFFLFYNFELKKYCSYNLETFETEILCINDSCENDYNLNCRLGDSRNIFEDNTNYFIRTSIKDDKYIYKTNIKDIFDKKCADYEIIFDKDSVEFQFALYPNGSLEYGVAPFSFDDYTGFYIVEKNKIKKRIDYILKENWSINYRFEYLPNLINSSTSINLSKQNEIFSFISYRSKSEIENVQSTYNLAKDPEALEARNASGWYRMDTNGQNAVQLVRSWPHNPGGLQISGDGETIYYAYILPDSTSAIMKMDRYGKNKEIVFKLDPEVLSVDKQVLTPKIYPNPANGTVTISGIEQGKLEIYDTLGKLIFTQDFIGQSQIDVSNLQTGVYIIKIESLGEVKFEKLIINK